MKFERERDIPAFKGTTWRERTALRRRAKERDRSIVCLLSLSGFFFLPPLVLAHWLMSRVGPQSFLAFIVLELVLTYLLLTLFYGLFITPRIRKALESDAKSSA
jgi:hypothetical protein